MSSEPLRVVEAHVDAFNARDVDACADTFAEDAVFAMDDQLVVGRRGIRTLFADSFAAPANAQLEVLRAVVQGDTAACELVERVTLGEASTDVFLAGFYTVRDGLLVRVKVYREIPG